MPLYQRNSKSKSKKSSSKGKRKSPKGSRAFSEANENSPIQRFFQFYGSNNQMNANSEDFRNQSFAKRVFINDQRNIFAHFDAKSPVSDCISFVKNHRYLQKCTLPTSPILKQRPESSGNEGIRNFLN